MGKEVRAMLVLTELFFIAAIVPVVGFLYRKQETELSAARSLARERFLASRELHADAV
jgi:hypothetical protein